MEGFLLIPPDRGTIIGRAIWKVFNEPLMFFRSRVIALN